MGFLGKDLIINTALPALRSPLLKPKATLWGVANIPRNGDYLEPDKLYDSNFGGYYHNEVFYKPAKGKTEKRWVANNLSQTSKNLNRIFGLSLQNKQSLTKKELAEYKAKMKRIQERMKNN